MNATRKSSTGLLPLRLIVLGGVLACALLAARKVPSKEWPGFLTGTAVISSDGSTLIAAMHDRFGTSLLILLGTMILAVSSGMALTLIARRIGFGMPSLVAFVCRLLALVPVVALAWAAVGLIVGVKGWPIESLLPHHPAPDRDTWQLAAGRETWKWLVPCWVLALPIAAEFLARCHECLRRWGESPLNATLHARGLKHSRIFHHHTLALARAELLENTQSLGFVALGWLVFVEDVLGIPGWGAFFATAIENGDTRGIAASVYVAGWLAAVWCLLVGMVRRVAVARKDRGTPIEIPRAPDAPASTAALTSALLFTLLGCSFASPPAENDWPGQLASLVSPLVRDLTLTTAACGTAVVLALVMLPLSVASKRLPIPLPFIDALAISPALVWVLAVASLSPSSPWLPLGLFIAPAGALIMRDRWRALADSGAMEASLALGTSRLRAWRMHVMPDVFRHGLAWALDAFATLLVWLTLADSLLPMVSAHHPSSLGAAISLAKDNVLADIRPVLFPALVAAICALFFRLLSLIVRPAPPPH